MNHQNIIIPLSVDELKEILSEIFREHYNQFKTSQTEKSDLPELITPKQTANYLGISKVTLWKWTKEGKLLSYQISGRIRYKRDEIIKALQEVKNLKYRRAE